MTFKQQMSADIKSVFMNTDEFAVDAVYNGDTVKGQFLEEVVNADGTETFYKMFICAFLDVPAVAVGDVFTVGGVAYGVVDFNVDDFGDTVSLFLSKELS